MEHVGGMRNEHNFWIGKPESKRPLMNFRIDWRTILNSSQRSVTPGCGRGPNESGYGGLVITVKKLRIP